MNTELYVIYTKNRHNQVLVFTSYQEAFSWCKAATTWTDDRIKHEIKTGTKSNSNFNFYNFFE